MSEVRFGCFVGAVLVQESKNVRPPDVSPEIPKGMPILNGISKGWEDFHFIVFASFLHRSRERAAGREIIVILGLKEEDRHPRITDSAGHQSLNLWGIFPTLSGACRIDPGTVGSSFCPKHNFDPAERSTRYGDALGINEALRSQPRECSQLIIQVIGFQ